MFEPHKTMYPPNPTLMTKTAILLLKYGEMAFIYFQKNFQA